VTKPGTAQADRLFRLEAQLIQVNTDLDDLADQVASGDIDPSTAGQLRAKYQDESDSVSAEIVAMADIGPSPTRKFSSRRFVGVAILIGAFVAVIVVAAGAIKPRVGGFVTGGGAGQGINLDEVTNDQIEAVIAANPDNPEIAGMRVALANRYFEEGNFSEALSNYLAGLDGALVAQRRAQALGRVAWMTFLSGETQVAELYLQQSLETDPDYAEGKFFYGLLLMDGLARPCDAIVYLEALSDVDDIPTDVTAELDLAIARARSDCG